MAVDLSKLISKRKIDLDELNGKSVAIDAFNVLYQFMSTIRQQDGTPLMDSNGMVTSHLSGLFYRNIDLIGKGIDIVYVFDGIPSLLKKRTIEARMRRREAAYSAWQEAKDRGDFERAKTYAQASTRIDKTIIESSKKLLDLMGIPHINAPSEGEGQASYMCSKGLVYAVGSQDYDTMLFGATRVVRNLTLSGRRKLPGKNIYINVEPELVEIGETLKALEISRDQLIWLGLLLGTDFNEGIKGVGPKTALKLVKTAESIDDVRKAVREKFKTDFQAEPEEVIKLFKSPEVIEVNPSQLKAQSGPDLEGIVKFMCTEHGFSEDRIGKYAAMLVGSNNVKKQQGLGKWF
jgi:flap endonuclease-1